MSLLPHLHFQIVHLLWQNKQKRFFQSRTIMGAINELNKRWKWSRDRTWTHSKGMSCLLLAAKDKCTNETLRIKNVVFFPGKKIWKIIKGVKTARFSFKQTTCKRWAPLKQNECVSADTRRKQSFINRGKHRWRTGEQQWSHEAWQKSAFL